MLQRLRQWLRPTPATKPSGTVRLAQKSSNTRRGSRVYAALAGVFQAIASIKVLDGLPPEKEAQAQRDLTKAWREWYEVQYERAEFPACAGCDEYGHGYMIQDELWESVAEDGDIFLCLECVQKRLERPLVPDDFKDLPLNKPIFAAMELGAQAARSAQGDS